MRVVVDANILLAAILHPGGITSEQLRRDDVEFVSPAFVREELREAEGPLRQRAGIGRAEWRRREVAAMARVRLVPQDRVARHERRPLVEAVRAVDPKHAQYVAAFLAVRAHLLWTRDQAIIDAMPERAVRVLPPPIP